MEKKALRLTDSFEIIMFLLILICGLLAGAILGLAFSAMNRWDQPGRLLGLGGGFGAFIGLICGILNYLLRRRVRLRKWKMIVFPAFGAFAGACVFTLFSEGLAMAVYLAVEGAILGLVTGFAISVMLLIVGRACASQQSS